MIYFSDASGTLTRCVPEQVYQGSAEGNRLFLVAPFAQNAEVYAAFRLPDGSSTERYRLERTGLIGGIAGAGGAGVYGWRCALPACVTEQYGSVTVQFFRFVAGEELSVFAAQFTVERGVQPQLPAAPGADVYREIVDALAAIGADLRNGFFAARAIFAWNAAYAYGANEIAYYPTGEHGALVRSLHADNTQPPYTADGALNSAHWAEELNFAAVSEQYLGAVQAEADRAEEAADRAQLLAERLASVLDKDVLLVDELPASPQEDTLYLLAGEGDALFELWIYDGEWVSFGGADIVLNTTGFHSGTLTQGGWSGGRQTVAVADIAAEDAVYAVPEDGYAAAYLAAGIRAAECADGGVVFTCKSPPSQDIRVSLAVTKRQDAPRVSVEGYYTKEEADSALSAEASARSQADLALGGRIDSLLSGGTPVARATSAASADTAAKATGDASGNDIAATYATKSELAAVEENSERFREDGAYPDLVAGTANFALQADQAGRATSAASADYAEVAFHADAADTATSADSAAHADSADTATTATNATNAAHATSADNAAHADSADTATTATNAAHAASADTATKATQDANGNDIAATYATKTELSGAGGGNIDGNGTYPYLSVGQATHAASADNAAHADSADTATTATNATHAVSADNAAHADSADTATTATSAASAVKATQDANGNDIAATYVKQSDVQLSLQQLQNGTIVVGRATGDANGNDIAATYATKEEVQGAGGGSFNASGSYPDLVAGTANFALQADQAVYASSAGSAEFAEIAFQADAATSDGLGNNIAETYATKAELAAAAVSAASVPAAVSAASVPAAVSAASVPAAVSAPAAASASVPGSAVGKASLSAEGDTAKALCRHDLLVCGGEAALTATIFSRDTSPFGTAQALLCYLGGAGYRVAEGASPLPAAGCCGGAIVYGIGAHAAFPQSLGIFCGGAGQEPAAAHLAADGLTVTDHVTEI